MPALSALSGRRLKELATSGGFAIDDNTGNRMIEALEAAIEALESRWSELVKLQETPPMSETPAARWVAQHMVDTAADADGLLTQLNAARTEFPTYVEAIELAKRTYREAETASSQEFTGLRDRLDTTEA
ncbi:hypothetical protein [Actinophytocola sp.]|uniref:hypothetical protein n=1 Tax=Actinophytocola sp. TaxID=1872138 RepID=UPI002ED3340C